MKKKSLFVAGALMALTVVMLFSFKSSAPAPDKNAQSIGTVIASVLDYDHLAKINGDPSVIDPSKSVWVPADGRGIAGSALATQTGMATAPDLRGRFLRGLNTIYSTGQPGLDISTADLGDPLSNRRAGEFQKDIVGPHSHAIDMRTGYMMDLPNWKVPASLPTSIFVGNRNAFGGSYGNLTATPSGTGMDSETRPKNISVYYYIKIN